MDSSNSPRVLDPVKFLAEDLWVSVKSLDQHERVALLQFVLTQCKPLLQYMPGWQPFSLSLNGSISDLQEETSTDEALINFTGSQGLSGNMFCLPLLTDSLELPRGASRRTIYLSRDGRLFQWERTFDREERPNGLSDLLTTTSCSFSWLYNTDLLYCLVRRLDDVRLRTMISAIARIVRSAIEDREKKLDSLRTLNRRFDYILERMVD